MKYPCRLLLILMVCTVSWLCAGVGTAQEVRDDVSKRVPAYHLNEIRYTAPDAHLRMPYALHYEGDRTSPTTGVIDVTPEYEPLAGVIFTWGAGWNSKITDMTLEAADAANNSKAFIIVKNATQQTSAYNTLSAAGVDMNQVVFITHTVDSVWCRDFGPHFIFHDDVRCIVDSHYGSSRPNDDATPNDIADYLTMPLYDMPVVYSGGNYQATSNKHGYVTDIIDDDNPQLTQAQLMDLFFQYQGVETLHIFPAFPFSIDGTGHIDMWMYIASDDKVIIGQYDEVTPGYQAYVITENAVTYMESLGFTVYRTPAYNSGSGGYGGVHYTYTNAFALNNKIFIIKYGGIHATRDRAAKTAFSEAFPGYQLVEVPCADIIPYAGAIHCISMQVPAYENADPCAKVLSPNGGELWAASDSHDIRWAADDDEGVTAMDLYLSIDGGLTFPYVIATGEPHDGVYEDYTVPASFSGRDCMVKAVAHDEDLNESFDMSDADFATE
ncbi:MAG: agmatine deiminase family protein, partial [Planctomycetes bacterium]|nr:agmatine deiminase family protein [Planctomycetota bacterium]